MSFIGDHDWQLMNYAAWWQVDGRTVQADVRWNLDPDNDGGLFAATVDGVPRMIDDEGDLLALAPPGAEVTFERGGVRMQLRRAGRLTHARASAVVDGLAYAGPETVDASPCTAIEKAMYALGEVDAQRTAPRTCFFCTHSDYEPGTGFGCGHLACFVADANRYHQIATSAQPRERKWGMWRDSLRYRWVDECDTCPHWKRRPPDHGYRG
jgi:hypothetical protein